MKHFRSIQALRAVAALLVVGYHLLGSKFVTGQAGVDVFFVISGFIMATVGAAESPGSFAAKRVARIVPLYWAVTLAMCAGAVAGVFARFSFDAGTLAKSLLFIPYADPAGNLWPLVVPGWTLNLEILFYVVFAAGLAIGTPQRVAAALLCALVAAGLLTRPEAAPLRLWTSPLLLEFVAGMGLATAWRPSGAARGLSMIGAGVAGLALSAGVWGYTDANRIVVWGIPAALIVAGGLAIERAGRWPARALAPLERIGDASYSLYLLHGLVIAALRRKIGESAGADALILGASVAIAYASYRWFERPIGVRLGRSLRGGRQTGPASAVG